MGCIHPVSHPPTPTCADKSQICKELQSLPSLTNSNKTRNWKKKKSAQRKQSWQVLWWFCFSNQHTDCGALPPRGKPRLGCQRWRRTERSGGEGCCWPAGSHCTFFPAPFLQSTSQPKPNYSLTAFQKGKYGQSRLRLAAPLPGLHLTEDLGWGGRARGRGTTRK